jgi:hypothetical protein
MYSTCMMATGLVSRLKRQPLLPLCALTPLCCTHVNICSHQLAHALQQTARAVVKTALHTPAHTYMPSKTETPSHTLPCCIPIVFTSFDILCSQAVLHVGEHPFDRLPIT